MKTIIVLRHADVDPIPGHAPAPLSWPLNAAGQSRAKTLVDVVGGAGITAVFASPAARTQRTAGPLLAKLGFALRVPVPPADLLTEVLSDGAGGSVLVVGHSNTVPEILTTLGTPIPESALDGHADLFIVTWISQGQASLVRLKYGKIGT